MDIVMQEEETITQHVRGLRRIASRWPSDYFLLKEHLSGTRFSSDSENSLLRTGSMGGRAFCQVGLNKDGKEAVEDEPRSGRPPTRTTPANIERVRRMLADDLCLSLIAEELKISLDIDSVSNIVHKHLQKRKICARFVLHKLSDEQKQHQMETSGDFIDACDRNPKFLETIITGESRGATSSIRRPSDSPWNGVHRRLPPPSQKISSDQIQD
ncbi:hypothetical protein AVEN_208444-1 [Araneus ventricosus]|uniref:Uncharacterized protein n=1 Tax=Araneus ventricosus TaxID=182803 RepID=A0A4Y2EHC8_ARAVE|nr:hypothetical protein AVEN_208444-1 [Araneus ventricosus]